MTVDIQNCTYLPNGVEIADCIILFKLGSIATFLLRIVIQKVAGLLLEALHHSISLWNMSSTKRIKDS